ncbi:hypothetical protein Tco_1524146 [Tanacetum coccineum]
MSTRKQNSDEYHQESSITIQHCSFFIRSMDLYGTVLAYFKGRHIKVSAQQVLGFTIELKTQSNFKTTGLLQPWQTLCKIFSKYLTTHYAELLWEGLYYLHHHPTSSIPYPRFTKIIISHYMTIFPNISRRARDMYHNLQNDDIMKNIFNSGRHKNKVGMQIPAWMITDEMKHTEYCRMYAEVFGIDVPPTQSQPIESTHRTHRTTSTPRSPYPNKEAAELSALRRSNVIRLRIPERRSTRLTPPAPVPTVDKADEMIIQDTLQVSLAEHKSHEEQEARENVALEGLGSDKGKSGVEIAKEKRWKISQETKEEITNVIIPVNVTDEDEEITDEVYELKRREKGKNVEESRNSPISTPIRSPRIHSNLVSLDTAKLQELTDTPHTTSSSSSPHKKLTKTNRLLSLFKTKPTRFKRYKSFFHELQGRYGYLFAHLRARFMPRKSFDTLADNLHDVMVESLPDIVDKYVKKQVMQQVPEQVRIRSWKHSSSISTQIENDKLPMSFLSSCASVRFNMKFERHAVLQTTCRTPACYPRDQDDPHDDAHPEGENSAKRQKTSEYEAYVSGESSSGQVFQEEQAPSTLADEHQKEIMTEKIVLSLTRFRIIFNDDDIEERTSRWVNKCVKKFNPYAQYGVEHWKNPHAKIFYIRKQKEPGKPKEEIYSNSKIVQVIKTYWELGHEHKFITEIVARRANDCIVSITEPDYKNLNKNDIEDIYLLIMNGKVPDYADTGLLWSLSVFIRSSVIWERVHDFQLGIESYQQKVNLTAPTITFPGIEEHDMFSIIYEPVHGIIYKNSKKEKRVMRHTEIHKFCDATLNRVLEGLKSYNNDVKYGYVQKDLTKDETEYLKLFEEEIEERLKHRRQMRRWEMYVNGRPLGLRRERPE